jgi:hypothetical protein
VPVPLAGWCLRDSLHHCLTPAERPDDAQGRGFHFPPGAVLRPGQSVVVHVDSSAPDGDRDFHWASGGPVFQDVRTGPGAGRNVADGGYLFDPQGDLRAAHQYAPRAAFTFP